MITTAIMRPSCGARSACRSIPVAFCGLRELVYHDPVESFDARQSGHTAVALVTGLFGPGASRSMRRAAVAWTPAAVDRTAISPNMPQRLRQILFSVPVITAVSLLALYVAGGFLALPAIVKWQLEKQVPERLGQRISVGAVHFNPLALRLDVDDLALSGPEGQPLLAFKRLQADFELRSAIDRAWVFASATLDAPVVHIELTGDGRNNFSALLERLVATGEPASESGGLPRLVVNRVALTDARVDFSDRRLAPPLVARVEPLQLEIDDLSTLPASAARYRLSARTAAGETLTLAGELGLDPVAVSGELAVKDLAVATVVRGLSRFVALDSPAGTIGLAARFDLGVDAAGTIAGTVQDVDLDVAKLSVAAAGADAPLLAMESLALDGGRVDLDRREAEIAKLMLAKGRVAAAANEQGLLDWTQIVRGRSDSGRAADAAGDRDPTRAAVPRRPRRSRGASWWRAPRFRTSQSSSRTRRAGAARASARWASTSRRPPTIGAAGMRIELDRPRLSLAASRLEDGADRLDLPAARIEAGQCLDRHRRRSFRARARRAARDRARRRDGAAGRSVARARQPFGGGAGVTMVGEGAATTGTIDDATVTLASAALRESGQSASWARSRSPASASRCGRRPGQVTVDVTALRSTLADLAVAQAGDGLDIRAATLTGETLSLDAIRRRNADRGGHAGRVAVGTGRPPRRRACLRGRTSLAAKRPRCPARTTGGSTSCSTRSGPLPARWRSTGAQTVSKSARQR